MLVRGARQVGKTYAVRELGKGFDRFLDYLQLAVPPWRSSANKSCAS
jgi:predicted AAA+ superfamily ATPase